MYSPNIFLLRIDHSGGYCTEFIVARENSKSPELLRSFLKNLGDCVVVVDDDEIIKVHVHTNVPGEVLTEALTYGPLQTVKIENTPGITEAKKNQMVAEAKALRGLTMYVFHDLFGTFHVTLDPKELDNITYQVDRKYTENSSKEVT